MTTLLIALGAYLLGCVPFAVVVSRAFGLADPRSYGSGNPGATNVLRSGNKAAAALTLFGDALKGWLAIFLVQQFAPQAGPLAVAVAALAVFFGHVFPVTLKFKGGKGVATAFGVLLGFSPWLGLATALVWFASAKISRYSSLAALIAAIAAPGLGYGLGLDPNAVGASVIMSLILIFRHSENIRRLLAGTEGKIGEKKKG